MPAWRPSIRAEVPSLTIGIPTRNRADLATAAIESVMRSGCDGVTVVVSDNSTEPDEARRLEDFCSSAATGVSYVRPPEPLPMAEHWEWLWCAIRDTTRATHVVYLTDRLVFSAGSLAALLEAVRRHPEHVVSYHWDHVADTSRPVELVQRPWTGGLYELSSARLLELSSRGEFGDYLPRLMNAVAPLTVVRQIESRFGDVAPDYRFAYRCLAVTPTILYLDRACVLEHGVARSAGINFSRGTMNDDATRFARELATQRFGATPEPGFATGANARFQEYCAVRDELGGDGVPPVDRHSYLAANAVSIARIADPERRERMHALLTSHGWTRRDSARRALGVGLRMAAYLIRHPGALARTLKRQLWDRPPGTAMASLMALGGLQPRVRDEMRFDSAAEAIAYADAHPRPAARHSFHIAALRRARAIVAERG